MHWPRACPTRPHGLIAALSALLALAAPGIGAADPPPTSAAASPSTSPSAAAGTAPSSRPPSRWTPSVSLSVKEEYDSNIYLQDVGALSGRDDWVTTVIPAIGIRYAIPDDVRVAVTYAPEIAWFPAESEENHVLHRIGLTAGGPTGRAGEWDLSGGIVAINGSDLGLIFTGPGGAPAAGGPRLRDRRDGTAYRATARWTQPWGRWLVRPVITGYLHDFQTEQFKVPGYANYVDRKELNGGIDIGTRVAQGVRVFAGYRYGAQDQSHLLDYPEECDSQYQRALVSIEGAPWSWVKAAVVLGPEFRRYADTVPAGFGDLDELNLFTDATLSFVITPSHGVTASVKLFEQPGFLGRAVYEDLTYDLSWRWKATPRNVFVASGRAYNTDFHAPAVRNDWVVTCGLALAHDFTSRLVGELSFTHEEGISLVAHTEGREYTRNVVAAGLRYTFR